MCHCYICYNRYIEEDSVCDICGNYYCEECSYIFSLHYPFQGSRCYLCADQRRLTTLTEDIKRNNKIKLIIDDDD